MTPRLAGDWNFDDVADLTQSASRTRGLAAAAIQVFQMPHAFLQLGLAPVVAADQRGEKSREHGVPSFADRSGKMPTPIMVKVRRKGCGYFKNERS
jgi:hypothetical protein